MKLLDKTEAPEGYAPRLTAPFKNCNCCAFDNDLDRCVNAPCLSFERLDCREVYFVKKTKSEKPKPKATYAQWAKKVGLIQPTGTVWNQWHMEDYTHKAYNAGRRSRRG